MKQSYASLRDSPAAPPINRQERHWVLIINHHEARIFDSAHRGTNPITVRPLQSEDSILNATRFDPYSRGQEKPHTHSYFNPIADALAGADRIVILGSGHGMANEMDQFIDWLRDHRPALAARIAGSLIVDEHHMTDNEMLALTREHFKNDLLREPVLA